MRDSGIVAIVQARMGSSRLPGKSFELIAGLPVVEIVLRRLERAQNLRHIVLATSNDPKDDILARHVSRIGFEVYRGSENDLVERFYTVAKKHGCENLLRATADNVFMDWTEVDRQIEYGLKNDLDFVTWQNPDFPDRMNDFAGEFISFSGLDHVYNSTQDPFDREHVYPYFLNNEDKFKVQRLDVAECLRTDIKFDLDEEADLHVVRAAGENMRDPILTPTWEIVKAAKRLSFVKSSS